MVEMDFHGMKRKKLQALCKKHGIPANLKNKEMADRLSLIFKGKEIEDPVGSGNASGTKKNTVSNVELIDLVSPSPRLEERSDFSAKIWKNSEVERLEFELNLSPQITREGFEICGVKEDMKSGLNEEQVGKSQGVLDSAPDEVNLVEGDVEKLGDQANLLEDVCGTGIHGAEVQKQKENVNNPEGSEAEKQEDNNANCPEESNRNDLNLFLVSPEEFGYPLVEGEVKKSDDCARVDDAIHNVENGRCRVDSMCLDTSTGTMDIDGKTDVAVEDEVHSSSKVNSTELNILEMVVSGTASRNAETCEARIVSSPKMNLSPASERMISLSPKLNNSESEMLHSVTKFSPETLKVDIEVSHVKENVHIDVNKELVGDSPKVVLAAPNEMAMTDEDFEQVPSDKFGDHLIDREVEKLGDKNNLLEDVCEIGEGGDEVIEEGDHNSPRESNIENVNVLDVSQEKSGYLLEEEIENSDDNIYNGGVCNPGNSGCEADDKDTDEKTNLTAEPFADDVPSSLNKYSDGTPGQFQRTYPVTEVNSTGLNIHQNICEEKIENVEYSQEAMHITADICPLNESVEQWNMNIEQGELTRLLDNSDVCDDAGGNTDDTNSSQDLNKIDLNISQVSHKEFDYRLAKEVHKSDDAFHNVENGRSDVDTMWLDSSTGIMDIDGKTDVAVEDEVHSCSEVSSNEFNILEMVVSGTASRNAEICEARFVSSPKMSLSPASERMIGLSPKMLNNSESKLLQSVTNISPEALKADIEVCDVKGNIQIDLNKEQAGGNQEVVREAANVMAISDEDLGQVRAEEFGDHSMDREVEKLSDKNNVLENVCEDGKGRDEAVEQGDYNSPQGSIMKIVNVLHVSQDESGYALVEDNVCNGGVYTSGSEAASKDTDVLNNLTTEHFADDVPSNFMYSDGAPDHFLRTFPLNEVNCGGLDIHQDTCEEELKSPQKTGSIACPGECIGFSPNMTTVEQFMDEVRSSTFEDSDGTPVQFLPNDALVEVKSNLNICEMDVPDIGNEDMPEAKFVSSSKKSLSPTSERMIGFCPKQLNNSETKMLQSETNFFPETSRVVDIGICDVEEIMRIDVNKELVDDNQQVILAVSSVTVSNNEDLVQVASVEVGENLLEGEVGILLNNLESSLPSATKGFRAESYADSSTLGDVVATCNVQNELVLLQTSMEESNSVEGEITRLLDNSDDHEDAGVTEAEEDKYQHNIKRDMDKIEKPDEFDYAPTMHQSGEMKSCTFKLQQISASGTTTEDEGTFQEKLETPPKFTPIASLEDSIGFYPKLVESSMKNELKIVKSLPVKRARDVLGTSNMKENMKIAKKEQVGTIITKSAFPKRKPLQDLQQN